MNYNVWIPLSVKVFTIILISAGLFFGYVYTFNPSLTFPGTAITDYSSQFGFGSAGVRVFGWVFALIVCLLLNNPRFLLITMFSRVFVELGDVILWLSLWWEIKNAIPLIVLASFEIWAVIRLSKVVKWKE